MAKKMPQCTWPPGCKKEADPYSRSGRCFQHAGIDPPTMPPVRPARPGRRGKGKQ